jgi:AcrR family transcriptional regulator
VSTPTQANSTRATILDAAVRLFTQRGARIRLEDIAGEAGVSRQTVYVHFGSRTGLLVAMAQHVDEGGALHDLVQQVFQAPGAVDALKALVAVHAEYHPVAYPIARVLMTGRHEDEAIRAAWDDRMTARHNLDRSVIEWLVEDGRLAPGWSVEVATDLLWSLTSWQVWEQLVVDREWTQHEYLTHVRSVLSHTLVSAG